MIEFIGSIPGKSFLWAFICWSTAFVLLGYFASTWTDNSRGLAPKEIGSKLNIYQIAYLRGHRAVGQLVVANLVQRRYLKLSDSGTHVKVVRPKPGEDLNRFEQYVLKMFKQNIKQSASKDLGMDARAFFNSSAWEQAVDSELAMEIHELQTEQLLIRSQQPHLVTVGVWLLGIAPGATKLAIALSRGYTNVAFLIFLMVLYTILFFIVIRNKSGLSRRGRRYLRDLRNAYDSGGESKNWDDNALAMSIVGGAAIAANYPQLATFVQASNPVMASPSSAEGCSSCSSCSSCGGGCGGCGGCGG